MSAQDQAILEQVKKSLLSAGKQAKKEKVTAKAEYEENKDMGLVSDDQSLSQWCAENLYKRPSFMASYNNYQASEAQYMQILQRCDESAAKEWQETRIKAVNELSRRPEDAFEREFYIALPE